MDNILFKELSSQQCQQRYHQRCQQRYYQRCNLVYRQVKKPLLMAGSFLLFLAAPTHALMQLPLLDQHLSVIPISQQEVTRIAVKDDKIKQVFGVTSEMIIETDDELGQIFFKPVRETGAKSYHLTITTENGLTHDLRLLAQKKDAEAILFVPTTFKAGHASQKVVVPDEKLKTAVPPPLSLKPSSFQDPVQRDQQVILKAMATLIKEEGTQVLGQAERAGTPEVLLQPLLQQKEGDSCFYQGLIYTLRNTTDQTLALKAAQFQQGGDVALYLSLEQLKPGQTGRLYILKETSHEAA